MNDYTELLKAHLVRYARTQLRITEPGVFRWKERDLPYHHILPVEQAELNFLPDQRAALRAHLQANPRIRLHRFFHHLSSSQAFALNLFYPFLTCEPPLADAFFRHFGTTQPPAGRWEFERVPDPAEGTNVDVAWATGDGGHLYCEVKLTEAEFGAAKNLPKHLAKLASTYHGRLAGLVPPKYLEPAVFLAHYQILRNVALLHRDARDRLVFLLPRANEAVQRKLKPLLDDLPSGVRARVRLVFVEALLDRLLTDASLPPALREHAAAVKAKYVPCPGPVQDDDGVG